MPFDEKDHTGATVSEFLRRIFPYGTWWPDAWPKLENAGNPDFTSAPNFPTDAFAAAALLLVRSGAIAQLFIGDPGEHRLNPLEPALAQMRSTVERGGPDFNNDGTCRSFQDAGREWSQTPRAPGLVAQHWKQLLAAGNEPVYKPIRPTDALPVWWTHALAILIIADHACEDVGWGIAEPTGQADRKPNQSIIAKFAQEAYLKKNQDRLDAGTETITLSENLETLCLCVDPEVVCVQPKARTPAVGCTLRGYTHNLALLPPRGIMKTYWHQAPGTLRSEDMDTLNLLVIPYPYNLNAKWFEAAEVQKWNGNETKRPRWGWFHLHQKMASRRNRGFHQETH